MSSLIRGAAKPEDIDLFASASALQFSILHARTWFEWVDSDANPADGLSRLGVFDPWTIKQGWVLEDLGDYDWSQAFEGLSLETFHANLTR